VDRIDDVDGGAIVKRFLLIILGIFIVGGCMAGSIIYTPNTGDDWATAWEQAEYTRKGKMGLSLTNYDNTSLPAVASGSWAEVAGSIYKWTGEEAISGSLSSSAINYIKLVPSGSGDTAIVTATWTADAPTWSDAYQGYYSGTSRYVGGCWYDGALYTAKWIYGTERTLNDVTILNKVIEIGAWNMDSTSNKSFTYAALGIGDNSLIYAVNVTIRIDVTFDCYPLIRASAINDASCTGLIIWTPGTLVLYRTDAEHFDSTNFDDPTMNRGWIHLVYKNIP
jgi:hypothetical protein